MPCGYCTDVDYNAYAHCGRLTTTFMPVLGGTCANMILSSVLAVPNQSVAPEWTGWLLTLPRQKFPLPSDGAVLIFHSSQPGWKYSHPEQVDCHTSPRRRPHPPFRFDITACCTFPLRRSGFLPPPEQEYGQLPVCIASTVRPSSHPREQSAYLTQPHLQYCLPIHQSGGGISISDQFHPTLPAHEVTGQIDEISSMTAFRISDDFRIPDDFNTGFNYSRRNFSTLVLKPSLNMVQKIHHNENG